MSLKGLYDLIGGDYQVAVERFSGNDRMLQRFLLRFPQDKSFHKFVDAYENGHETEAYNAACTLMEVSDSLALISILRTARVIVEAYHTGEASTRAAFNLPVLVDTLREQYQSVISAISDYREQEMK